MILHNQIRIFTKAILFSILGTALFIVGMAHLFLKKDGLNVPDVVIIILLPIIGSMVIGGLFASPETIQKFFSGTAKLLFAWRRAKAEVKEENDTNK